MYMFFAMNLVLAFFVYFFIPETKGKSLESMDILFGGANHAEDTTPDNLVTQCPCDNTAKP